MPQESVQKALPSPTIRTETKKAAASLMRLGFSSSAIFAEIRARQKKINPDSALIGEVWEDASNKKAYGRRRTYFTNAELDSVMNYPYRTAILNFMRGFDSGAKLKETVMSIAENYPPQVVACNMNLLGTHDTPRILTALVDDFDGSREEKSKRRLSRNQYATALERLLMASFLQFTLPGCPCIYYGDEVGMQGYRDPFSREPYRWELLNDENEVLKIYKRFIKIRKSSECFSLGELKTVYAYGNVYGFLREQNDERFIVLVNFGEDFHQNGS